MFGSDDFLPRPDSGPRQRIRQWFQGGSGTTRSDGNPATILVYRSVGDVWAGSWIDPRAWIPESVFERHLEFLKAERNVISLRELVDALANRRPVAPRTVVLTFDDGYLDHVRCAAPRLAALGLPATFFVPSGWVGQRAPWTDDLYSVLRHRRNSRLDLGDGGRFNLLWPGQVRRAYLVLHRRLFALSEPEERRSVIENVRRQLETYGYLPRRTMTWDEVKSLAAEPGLELGTHGDGHLSLPSLAPDAQRAEIQNGVEQLERAVGRRPEFFAYPYGHRDSATDAVVAEFGFLGAVTSGRAAVVDRNVEPMKLFRVSAPSALDELELATA